MSQIIRLLSMYEDLLELKVNLQFLRENVGRFRSEFKPVRIPFSSIFLQRLAFLIEDISVLMLFPHLSHKFQDFAKIVLKFHTEREELSGKDILSEIAHKQILDLTKKLSIFIKDCEDFIEDLSQGLKKQIIKDPGYEKEVLLFFESDAKNSFTVDVTTNILSKLNKVQELFKQVKMKVARDELLDTIEKISAILISIRFCLSDKNSVLIGSMLLALQLQVSQPNRSEGKSVFSESEKEFLTSTPVSRSTKIKMLVQATEQFTDFNLTKKKLSAIILFEKKNVLKVLKNSKEKLIAIRVKFYKKHTEFEQKSVKTIDSTSPSNKLSEQLNNLKKGKLAVGAALNDDPKIKLVNQYISQLKTHRGEVLDRMKKLLRKPTFAKINRITNSNPRMTMLKQMTKKHKFKSLLIQLEKERVGYDNSIAKQEQRIKNIITARDSEIEDSIKQLKADIADLAKKSEK